MQLCITADWTSEPGVRWTVSVGIRGGKLPLNLQTQLYYNMVTGMLAAALFLGSSMIISAKIAPRIGEFSILGLIGYVLSLYLGFRLIRNINKKNDDKNI